MGAAIYFHPEPYSTSGKKLMGRNAAGESFLRGYTTYSENTEFCAVTREKENARPFIQAVRSIKPNAKIRILDEYKLGNTDPPEVIFYPGPGLSQPAFQRSNFNSGAWSVYGIAHTTSSDIAMDNLVELLVSPIESWDALICPSEAVKTNILSVLNAQRDFLSEKLNAKTFTYPQLPVIPLGVHPDDFVFSQEERERSRNLLGIDCEAVVVAYMGRLSFHAKAHPVGMYRALEEVSKHTGKQIVLIECGWHGNDAIKQAFTEAQGLMCPSINSLFLDGREESNRNLLWSSADIFCSFSDNIQETFGITPLEAMAASLPVVVSDWDGYMESVQDGVEGFKIPTIMPEAGHGEEFARRFGLELETYDRYCGKTFMFVAVEQEAAVNAFKALIESPELRIKMGEKGRQRVEKLYDWRVIIPQYNDLWSELNSIRQKNTGGVSSNSTVWPARQDPYRAFAHYASQIVTKATKLSLVDDSVQSAISRVATYRQLKVFDFASEVFPTDDEITALLEKLFEREVEAGVLIKTVDASRQDFCMRALNWLLKIDIIKISK
ncbi:MAG: glycosyltransferase family 4 protein [Gammaproteobacteria bacterium]|nr:glycosyltransferase family 4 protein [Gammaproteobacteria bacterium]